MTDEQTGTRREGFDPSRDEDDNGGGDQQSNDKIPPPPPFEKQVVTSGDPRDAVLFLPVYVLQPPPLMVTLT